MKKENVSLFCADTARTVKGYYFGACSVHGKPGRWTVSWHGIAVNYQETFSGAKEAAKIIDALGVKFTKQIVKQTGAIKLRPIV